MDIEDLSEDVWDTEGISGKPPDTRGISGQLLSTRGASEKLGLSFLSNCACKGLVLPESARPATSTTTEQSYLAGFGRTMSLGRTIYLFLQSTLCGLLPVVEASVPVVCLADCTRVISSAAGRATYELNPYKVTHYLHAGSKIKSSCLLYKKISLALTVITDIGTATIV